MPDEHTPAREPDWDERIWRIVWGGAVTSHARGLPVCVPYARNEKPVLRLRTVPHPDTQKMEDVETGFPARLPFGVYPTVVTGTIDEIVEHFRTTLTEAVTTVVSLPKPLASTHEQAKADALAQGYRPGKAQSEPVRWDNPANLALEARFGDKIVDPPLHTEFGGREPVTGKMAYEAYAKHTNWKSLASGQDLPQWDGIKPEIQAAWNCVAETFSK